MLKTISCDKFMENHEIRKTINFHYGLNTVLGDSESSNSIGKSTFLMIIDFCFGGEDYFYKEKGTLDEVGPHTIKFTYEFDGKEYYFSRSTDNHTIIHQYSDSEYKNEIKKMSLENFKYGLLRHYNLQDLGLTFRNVVGRVFRIYNRNTHNELRPLNAVIREDDKSGIVFLLKLFNLYGDLDDIEKLNEEALYRKKALDNLKKYTGGNIASNEEEVEKNKVELEKLVIELQTLNNDNEAGHTDVDFINASIKNDLKNQRTRLRSQLRFYTNKLDDITFDKDYDVNIIARDYAKLKEFFPELNTEKLDEYEAFHKDVKKILGQEIKTDCADILDTISFINEQLTILTAQLKEYKNVPNISDAYLKRRDAIITKMRILEESNKNFIAKKEANSAYTDITKKVEQSYEAKIRKLSRIVNDKMVELNKQFENGKLYPPVLSINSIKSYSFSTTNDTGTGSRFKGVAIFDLALLMLTKLPAFVHDSIMFTNIETPTVKKLLELYAKQTNKQIFIAFDHYDKDSGELLNILTNNKVLELSDEPNCLFGRQWNKQKISRK